MNKALKFGGGVIALIVAYTVITGRPPFYSSFVADDYSDYSSNAYTPPYSGDSSSSSTGTAPYDPSSSSDSSDYGGTTSDSTSISDPYGTGTGTDLGEVAQADSPAEEPYPYPEQPLPANGEVQNYSQDEAIAPFTIRSQGGNNFLVKLSDADSGTDVMTIFVRGGEDVETSVPIGTYIVKYASGTTWYGYDQLFGPQTGYSKADETFDFVQEGDTVKGFSVTLYAVEGGNLSTSTLSPSEF